MTNETATKVAPPELTLTEKFAQRYSVDPHKLMSTLKATAFKQKGAEVTNEQMMALLVVADQYGLNPFTKEIYAFPDKQAGIIPVVGVDGWSRIINSNSQMNGMDFVASENFMTYPNGDSKPCPEWIECVIKRKDRDFPIVIREYLDEVFRPPFTTGSGYKVTGPWQSHTKRMLRHKAMIQCARVAFGFVGIYDQDEAERIAEFQERKESRRPAIQINEVDTPMIANSFSQNMAKANLEEDESEFVDVRQSTQADQTEVNGEFVEVQHNNLPNISAQDKNFIRQLVSFASKTGSWETTLDNFKERYSGETFEYAQAMLDHSYNACQVLNK